MKLRFTAILFLLALYAGAQDFKSGIRFGVNGSQVNGDGLEGFDKAGVFAGIYVYRNFSEKVSLQMEMVFIQKGSRMPTTEDNVFYRMRLGYVEVPLLLQYHFTKKIAVYGGLSFGVLVSSEEADQFGVFTDRPPFKKFEVAGNGGIIYKLSDKWSFDGRYSHSITTIRPYVAGPTTFFDKGQYNVVIEFGLTYDF